VNDPVPLQVVHQDEGFPALRAAVGPLPAVCALVDPQTALLREPLPALPATVRLLSRVSPVVYAEVGRALEAFPAHRAPERSLPLVALLVQLELVQAVEGLSALGARVAPGQGRERFMGGVRVEAAGCETVVRVSYNWSIPGDGLPLRFFFWLPQMSMRRVPRRVNLLLLLVLLRRSSVRSGLIIRQLWNILLILTAVNAIAQPLRRRLLDTR